MNGEDLARTLLLAVFEAVLWMSVIIPSFVYEIFEVTFLNMSATYLPTS